MKRMQTVTKCPKCGAKLKRDQWNSWHEKCNRCGYEKVLEPSNFIKRLYGILED